MSASPADYFTSLYDRLNPLSTRLKIQISPTHSYDEELPPFARPNVAFWSATLLKQAARGPIPSDKERPIAWSSEWIGIGDIDDGSYPRISLPRSIWPIDMGGKASPSEAVSTTAITSSAELITNDLDCMAHVEAMVQFIKRSIGTDIHKDQVIENTLVLQRVVASREGRYEHDERDNEEQVEGVRNWTKQDEAGTTAGDTVQGGAPASTTEFEDSHDFDAIFEMDVQDDFGEMTLSAEDAAPMETNPSIQSPTTPPEPAVPIVTTPPHLADNTDENPNDTSSDHNDISISSPLRRYRSEEPDILTNRVLNAPPPPPHKKRASSEVTHSHHGKILPPSFKPTSSSSLAASASQPIDIFRPGKTFSGSDRCERCITDEQEECFVVPPKSKFAKKYRACTFCAKVKAKCSLVPEVKKKKKSGKGKSKVGGSDDGMESEIQVGLAAIDDEIDEEESDG